MISTKDKLLMECHPSSITWDEYMEDCEKAINTPDLHSDEWSTEDEVLANDERNNNKKRPSRIIQTNSVIKIHDKKWRSTRVCKVLTYFFLKNITFINHKYIFFIRLNVS